MNRKYATAILYNGKKLREKDNFKSIYVNASLCKEFAYLNWKIRTAYKNKKIFRYRVKNGVNMIQTDQQSEFLEITHINDLVQLGLGIEE